MATPVFIPAPALGLHFGKPIQRTPDGYALELSNWVPRNGTLVPRLPLSQLANPSAQPEWMHSYVNGTTVSMLSVAENGVVRRHLPTDAAVASLTTGVTESVGFNFGGLLYYTAYPTNPLSAYDGTTHSVPTFTRPAAGDWAALTNSDCTGGVVFKGRVLYWSFKTDEFLYSALGAGAGTLTAFATGTISLTGGNIKLITTLTMDSGVGPDDLLCIILDTGEMLVYAGDDPSSAASLQLVGRFFLPPPVNADAVAQIGPDTLIVSDKGLVPIQNYIQQGFGAPQVEWLSAINPEIEAMYRTPSTTWRARLKHCPRNGFLLLMLRIVSSPLSSIDGYMFVLDTTSRKWTRFNMRAGGTGETRGSFTFAAGDGVGGALGITESFAWRGMIEHLGVVYFAGLLNRSPATKQVLQYGGVTGSLVGDLAENNPVELFTALPFIPFGGRMSLAEFMVQIFVQVSQTITERTYGCMFDGMPSTWTQLFNTTTDITYSSGANTEVYPGGGDGWSMAPTVRVYITYTTIAGVIQSAGWDTSARFEGMRLYVIPADPFASGFEAQQ